MILNLDHIAILTANLSATVAELPQWLRLDPPEEQPTEGTLEQYAHWPCEEAPSLLLLEALSDGPYRRALAKRGPGLHHLGCSTDSLDAAVDHFAAQGLFLHPRSRHVASTNGAWMCRPGVPFLVELYVSPEIRPHRAGEVLVRIPASCAGHRRVFDWMPSATIACTMEDGSLSIQVGDQQCQVPFLFDGAPHSEGTPPGT